MLKREEVLKLAKLSRLELNESEIEQYQKELNAILDYFERLNKADVGGLKPTYQVSGLVNVMRKDEIKAYQATPDKLMDIVPKSEDSYIKVGRML